MKTESSKDGRVMAGIGTFVGAVVGAVLGVCAGFFLPEPYLSLANPQVLKDGQWGMVLLTTIPVGLTIGTLIGATGGFLLSRSI